MADPSRTCRKLIIQVPCWNEAASLPHTLQGLPRQVPGVELVEVLVIDDGSTDNTAEVARQCGVEHLVRLTSHHGLAQAFAAGLEACLQLDADIIVSTDADNQYHGADVAHLIAPILEGRADFVIGTRDIGQITHFSPLKKLLQRLGSAVVRQISGTQVPDAASGFRAYSRDAAAQLNIFSSFSYTLESLIQAGTKNLRLAYVPIRVNPGVLRPSRLFRSTPEYLLRSLLTIIQTYLLYQPLRFLMRVGLGLILAGTLIGGRFLYYYLMGHGQGKVQSLVLAAILIVSGVQVLLTGTLAQLLSVNRSLNEEILYRLRRLERRTGAGNSRDRAEAEASAESRDRF